ncbi:hypothetical protein Tco_0670389 [Tanacetum coccineum]
MASDMVTKDNTLIIKDKEIEVLKKQLTEAGEKSAIAKRLNISFESDKRLQKVLETEKDLKDKLHRWQQEHDIDARDKILIKGKEIEARRTEALKRADRTEHKRYMLTQWIPAKYGSHVKLSLSKVSTIIMKKMLPFPKCYWTLDGRALSLESSRMAVRE